MVKAAWYLLQHCPIFGHFSLCIFVEKFILSVKIQCQDKWLPSSPRFQNSGYLVIWSGKWSVSDTVDIVESEIVFRQIMGHKHRGHSGFGLAKPFLVPPKGPQAYRKFISDLSEEIDGEESLAKAAQLHL